MIIGNGLIAKSFKNFDLPDVVFFASGVSNSLEDRKEEFNREEKLLRKTIEENKEKLFIYFSTCSIYDSSKNTSSYVNHKLKMEYIVENLSHQYLVLRVSNVVGKGGNKNTLINYLISAIKSHEVINVYTKATRNLIDIQDLVQITYKLINQGEKNKIFNIAYIYGYHITEILEIIENFLSLTPNIRLLNEGNSYLIDIRYIEDHFKKNNLLDKKRYLQNILEKYFDKD